MPAGKDAKERMLHYSRTVHIGVVTRDKGSGKVGVDRNQHPTFEYSLLAYDEDSMMTGVDQALRILVAAGAIEIGTHQFDGERFKVQGKKRLENLNPRSRICKSMIASYMHHCAHL
jgi:long-chain-alcohol oxidase